MSAYSDALVTSTSNRINFRDITNDKIKKLCFNKMKPQPLNYLINQNKHTILSICFILIIIYCQIFSILYPIMLNIYSKHEYFNEQLQIENEKLNKFKQKRSMATSYRVKDVHQNKVTID
ncbi:unnamed protein product [Rotaria sordida]|uniref:Uncharacterized protein n=1 Tax=Rotaria sordida TaxID=392033 RepID=A0A815NNX6_9BILA|nr:unnamed protein product [Rotaria sordida]CAF1442309.1 unnamed protein product [Rotaria sordida]CAF1627556.1 unnamed protein product [Rotaria sordida]CAF4100367.1 unnamed protein product [Rotaria sordida]